nr:MAG TPA: DNA polymerase B [Bacteriophage sp.]
MIYWTNYITHKPDILGKRKKFDNTIYTFDIETTSYLKLYDHIIPANKYLELSEEERKDCNFNGFMYIWMFSINDIVYYGRTWEEFKDFLKKIDENVPYQKTIFIHNLAFEFQFLKSHFNFKDVIARKKHKPMRASMTDYNFELRCSYLMSNCKLERLPELFNLPVKKLVGNLDYDLIRTPVTKLSEKELNYCENDCLVVYHYILFELQTYENINKIPITSTGHVRRELKELVLKDFKYKRLVKNAININPHVYNMLIKAFAGGYTHANWIYADTILNNIDSYDFTSSYPYIMVTHKFPSSEFRKCNIKRREDMSRKLCYLLRVKFTNIESKYYNNFISSSKCENIRGAKYDNGRIISASELEMTLTDIDFYFILDTHKCEYEILESYVANYNYLPKQFINFVLDKYVIKTKYKGIKEKELEYQKEKNKFNALYGMSVTNTIRDNVIYDNNDDWTEEELSNEEIQEKLFSEKNQAFLSFAYGVWVTAYARNNLLRNVIKLDKYVVYCDTDSMKLLPGYDMNVINEYNDFVERKIKFVSQHLNIDFDRFAPIDIKGKRRMLGVFDHDEHYDKFITQGAKKYAFEINGEIGITVAGVPKEGAKALKRLKDFRDDFVFKYEDTNKHLLVYCEEQEKTLLVDYQGNECIIKDKTGCCLIPTTYVLGKSLEYANLIDDNSSKRAIYKEV